jgi:hypothetical protein
LITKESIMSASFKIHTSIISAAAIKAVGEVVVSATWKETKNQTRMERAVILPMETLKAPEVPESFRALVELALASTAEAVLKAHCNSQPNNFEMLQTAFSRPALTEAFLSSGNNWLTKEELETAWNASATWKRITARPEFATNATYQKAAQMFKESILKLAAKPTVFTEEKCDVILAKLEASDLETELGSFICKRIESFKARKTTEEVDFSSL